MRYLSLFSGIEAASVAWIPLGWTCVGVAESEGHPPCIAFSGRTRGAEPAVGREERPPLAMIEKVGAIDTVKPWNVATPTMAVRRLTPRECERLQGFPNDYTRIPSPFVRKLGIPLDVLDPENPKHWAADGPRYKALGNSMAVNCMRWIGERIEQVSKIPTT